MFDMQIGIIRNFCLVCIYRLYGSDNPITTDRIFSDPLYNPLHHKVGTQTFDTAKNYTG